MTIVLLDMNLDLSFDLPDIFLLVTDAWEILYLVFIFCELFQLLLHIFHTI